MNCRDVERLICSDRDGALNETQRAVLAAHLGQCAGCRAFQRSMAEAGDSLRASAAAIAVPSAEREWQDLRRKIRADPASSGRESRREGFRSWVSPLAAAAVMALALLAGLQLPLSTTDAREPAVWAEYVETADPASTPVVFLDQESGWLVVWAESTS